MKCSFAKEIDSSLPKLFILAVGISDYANDDLDLTYADQDAKDFVAAWKRQLGRQYSEVEAKVVTNQEATVDGIEDGFYWLTDQEITEKDFVFVFLAGHAMFDDKDIWVFGSSDLKLGRRMKQTGITDSRVKQLLEQELHEAGTVILFLDTCHAGGVKGKTRGVNVRKHHSGGKNIWGDSQRHVLASCTQNELSMESSVWENGAFTEGLLEAMENGDTNDNGFISISELKLRSQQIVSELTKHKQTPTASGQKLNGVDPDLIKVR